MSGLSPASRLVGNGSKTSKTLPLVTDMTPYNLLIYHLMKREGLSKSQARSKFFDLRALYERHLKNYDLEEAELVLKKAGLPTCLEGEFSKNPW